MTEQGDKPVVTLERVEANDGNLVLALIDAANAATEEPDAPEWANRLRDELADRGFIIARHREQETLSSERTCSACDGEGKGCSGEYRCLRCEGSGLEPDTVMGLDNRTALSEGEGRDVGREALPRLDEGLIYAALHGHYGKNAGNIDGIDLTANGYNWSFRNGFKRMWAGVRAELMRRAALSTPLAPEQPGDN